MTSWGDGETDKQGHGLNDKAQLNQQEQAGDTANLADTEDGLTVGHGKD
jgi:hypothetical protein